MCELLGITTTIPIEIIFASGKKAKDLNNIFITSDNPMSYVEDAENAGFPRNMCAWIKGIYSVCMKHDIKDVIAVSEGDCSNSNSLIEILEDAGVNVIPVAYPFNCDKQALKHEIDRLIEYFRVSKQEVKKAKQRCDEIRKKIHEIDKMTWNNGVITGFENHLWQINTSDFLSDMDLFSKDVEIFLCEAKKRDAESFKKKYKLGYIGIPPIVSDLYDEVEKLDARIVFNEVQRQFSMPYKSDNLIEQYSLYTYPYNFLMRLEDIKEEIKVRKLDGLIHYTQSFCHRQMDDILIRKYIDIPTLTIECDKPGALSARNKIKLEGFVEILNV